MIVVKIVALTVVGVLAVVYLRQINSELASLAAIAAGAALLLAIVSYVFTAVDFLRDLSEKIKVGGAVTILVIKITVISYLIEFTESLCNDSGVTSLGKKVAFCGKVIIFVSGLPIVYELIESVLSLL